MMLIQSSVFNHNVAVLSLGCTPIRFSGSRNSLSINTFTLISLYNYGFGW